MKKMFALIVTLTFMIPVFAGAEVQKNDPRIVSALHLVDIWLDAQVDYKDIPGISVGIVYDQEMIWSRGYGFSHTTLKKPAAPNTIYSICSISKLFTSIAVMQLRDRGKLDLDDPIRNYLPWFNIKDKYPEAPEITLRGILTHSSGLPRESDYPYWTGPNYNFPTHKEIVEKISRQEELYPAQTYFQYSNLGLTLAGEVVAAVSGQQYGDYIQQHILTPLNMTDTTTEIPKHQRGKQLATPHGQRNRDGVRKVIPFYHVRGIAPAAGFASTVEDLGKFASWQFRLLNSGKEEILTANTLREMQRVQWVDPDWETHWGFGFSVYQRNKKTFVGHGGFCPGYKTNLTICPGDRVAVILMINGEDESPGQFTRKIYDIIAPAVLDTVKSPEKTRELDPRLNKFVGRYDHPVGGEIHIFPKDGELAMISMPTDNPGKYIRKLKHIEGNLFRRIRKDKTLGEKVYFKTGKDGKIDRIYHHSNYAVRHRD